MYFKVKDGSLSSVQLYVISEYATQWRDEPSSDDGEATSRCPPDDGTGAHGAAVWGGGGTSHADASGRGLLRSPFQRK